MLRANKGEWSELYVLFKILATQKLYAASGSLERLPIFYPVIKVIREVKVLGVTRQIEYRTSKEFITIYDNDSLIEQIPTSAFNAASNHIFDAIKAGPPLGYKGAFPIPSITEFLNRCQCFTAKAKSTEKADIVVAIYDYHTESEILLGFSIKSEAGNKSSLLNASSLTNVLYRLNGHIDETLAKQINDISSKDKVVERIRLLNEKGVQLEFDGFSSKVFESNLRMIDTKLPEILALMLLDGYLNGKGISQVIKRISESNPLNFDRTHGHDFYGYKMKSFLVATALGMKPSQTWSGMYEATGGYIIVKEDGDIVCFHTYDRNKLEEYLLSNTKFETPTSDPNKIKGIRYLVYPDGDKWFFNLNLQIRFK